MCNRTETKRKGARLRPPVVGRGWLLGYKLAGSMSASCPADGTASLQYLRSVRTAFSHLSPEVCVINDAGWCGWCWPASVPLSASVCGAACPIFFTCLLSQAFIDTLQCIGLQDTNLCHPSLPPRYLQHEEHRPLLPYCLLMGLERPQDVARFTAADVKAAGECRSWVGVDGAGGCELLYGVLSIDGASTSWLPWLTAAPLGHERVTMLNAAARVLISVHYAHTSFLLPCRGQSAAEHDATSPGSAAEGSGCAA
jgi:hypothetical protein